MPKSCGRRPWRRTMSGSSASRMQLAGSQTPAPSRERPRQARHGRPSRHRRRPEQSVCPCGVNGLSRAGSSSRRSLRKTRGEYCTSLFEMSSSGVSARQSSHSRTKRFHPRDRRRRRARGQGLGGRDPLPARAERIPPHRPPQVDRAQLRDRRRSSAGAATCASTTPTRSRKSRSTSTRSRKTSAGSASTGASISTTPPTTSSSSTTGPST